MAGLPRAARKNCDSFEITLLTGHFVQFDQGQFQFLVARHVDLLARAEQVVEVVGEPDGHIQQRAFARGAVVRDGRFDQVTRAVHLVLHAALGPLLARFDQRVVGVEVSIRALRGGDLGDDFVRHAVQHRVGMIGQGVGRAFEDLVDVRVIEVDALEFSRLQAGGLGEVREATRVLTPLEIVRQRLLAVDLQSRCPERIADLHLRERHGLQLAMRWFVRTRRTCDARQNHQATGTKRESLHGSHTSWDRACQAREMVIVAVFWPPLPHAGWGEGSPLAPSPACGWGEGSSLGPLSRMRERVGVSIFCIQHPL